MNLGIKGISAERLERIRPVINKHIGDDKLAGAVTLLYRDGDIVHRERFGMMDRERLKPMTDDAIFRIYSMTKPIVSTAMMMLYEKGAFQLNDPVSKFIPAFKGLKVCKEVKPSKISYEKMNREIIIHDLFVHTSGLTYHFLEDGPVEEMYRSAEICGNQTLERFVEDLCKMPLAFQPGESWRYSVSVDVLGHLVEIISGKSLDVFLEETLFSPLGMADTGYYVPKEKLSRFTAQYGAYDVLKPDITSTASLNAAEQGMNRLISDPLDCLESKPHNVIRGGHGLVSTISDYLRFSMMLLNRGELDGTRYLSPRIVEMMTASRVKDELCPLCIGDNSLDGYNFGLGFRVLQDPGKCFMPGSRGEYGWAGAANTYFWIDQKEKFIGILMTQFQPSGYHLISEDFRVLAYQALVD